MAGSSRIVQRDFSAGMFRSVAPELIPETGVWDLIGLLAEDGAAMGRGGTSYRSLSALAKPIQMVWDGLLRNGGQTTLIASNGQMAEVDSTGTVAVVGGATGLAKPGRPANLDGVLYLPGGQTYDGTTLGTAPVVAPFYAVVANRLIAAGDGKVSFSGIVATAGVAPVFDPTDYHLIPGDFLGLEGLRDQALVFTTDGAFLISGMALNLTDADGNVQQRIDHYSQELVLWGDAGIAAWEGGLVVPGTDAVWLVSLGVTSESPQAFQRMSGPIESLYRAYVSYGYQPGQATVHRGHYLLPIVSAGQVIDTLVCRLDAPGRPWSHLNGYGAECIALTRRTNAVSRRPELIGGQLDGRLMDLWWFDPGQGVEFDANGNPLLWSLTTRAMPTGAFDLNTVLKVRASYEFEDPDTALAELDAFWLPRAPTTAGTKWGQFRWGTGLWTGGVTEDVDLEQLAGVALETHGAQATFTWPIVKRSREAMLRLTSNAFATKMSLRALEVFVRQSNRV